MTSRCRDAGFAVAHNRVVLVPRDAAPTALPLLTKRRVATASWRGWSATAVRRHFAAGGIRRQMRPLAWQRAERTMKRPVTGSVRTRSRWPRRGVPVRPAPPPRRTTWRSPSGLRPSSSRRSARRQKVRADALARYASASTRAPDAKQQGDLDAVQAADAEIRRFDAQKTLPRPRRGRNAELARSGRPAASLGQGRARRREEGRAAHRAVPAVPRPAREAGRARRQLDVAKAFKTEMDTARQTPDYQAARFLLGEQQTAAENPDPPTPESKPPAATNAPPACDGPNGERLQLSGPEGLYDAARIFEGFRSCRSPPLALPPARRHGYRQGAARRRHRRGAGRLPRRQPVPATCCA